MNQEPKPERGLQYWMERVVKEADRARAGFEAGPVHDLRVAIRRCRSMADGFRMIDPEPAWNKMRKAGKQVFSALGDLRDVQVQMEWVQKLSAPDDGVRERLLAHFGQRETELKLSAAAALGNFDTKQWLEWAPLLGERAEQLPMGGEVFRVIALERWITARGLHRVAMRNRSKTALHQVRIGIKKFRYIVENFLPELHEAWIKELKEVQDELGEIHDLDVLGETARAIGVFATTAERSVWRDSMLRERSRRVEKYRVRMGGKDSLWLKWRAGLPSGEALRKAILKKFEVWSTLRDRDRLHTEGVLDLSLRLFDFLTAERLWKGSEVLGVEQRDLLTVAVLGHEAGRLKKGAHHKTVVKVFRELDVPPGWTPMHLRIAGLVARYHRGAPPNESQRAYASLRQSEKKVINGLAGMIRLADAVDRQRNSAPGDVNVGRDNGCLVISSGGIVERTRGAERIARARHLLESVLGMPIVVKTS